MSSARMGSTENIRLAKSSGEEVARISSNNIRSEDEAEEDGSSNFLDNALRIVIGSREEAEEV